MKNCFIDSGCNCSMTVVVEKPENSYYFSENFLDQEDN
jgi:hypothetical protein